MLDASIRMYQCTHNSDRTNSFSVRTNRLISAELALSKKDILTVINKRGGRACIAHTHINEQNNGQSYHTRFLHFYLSVFFLQQLSLVSLPSIRQQTTVPDYSQRTASTLLLLNATTCNCRNSAVVQLYNNGHSSDQAPPVCHEHFTPRLPSTAHTSETVILRSPHGHCAAGPICTPAARDHSPRYSSIGQSPAAISAACSHCHLQGANPSLASSPPEGPEPQGIAPAPARTHFS